MSIRRIFIEPTSETPKVVLDKENNIIELAGNSLPEDVLSFYEPILGWFDEYSTLPNETTQVVFSLEYYNTSSSKMILRLLEKCRDLHRKGHKIEVHWHYLEDDDDMIEAGEDYSENVKVPFKFFSRTR